MVDRQAGLTRGSGRRACELECRAQAGQQLLPAVDRLAPLSSCPRPLLLFFPLSRWYPLHKWAGWWSPAQLAKTAELDPAGRYLLGIHPHGVLGNSSLLALGTEALGWSSLFPGIRLSQGEQERGMPGWPAACTL